MLQKYFLALPYYFLASGVAFLFDISVYVLSWRYLGTNFKFDFCFFSGCFLFLFSILRLTRESKYKKKRHGLIVQLFIGLVSLSNKHIDFKYFLTGFF